MQSDQAIMHAKRIAKRRIEATELYDAMQDEEVSALSSGEQQQILKLVRERMEPRAVAQAAQR